VDRITAIIFREVPTRLFAGRATFEIDLERYQNVEFEIGVTGNISDSTRSHGRVKSRTFDDTLGKRRMDVAQYHAEWTQISASNELFDSLLQRSAADLASIINHSAEGTFIRAGTPWFASLFGRDSLITALSLLPFNPQIAVGTLTTLAGVQGTQIDTTRDEQPGKIVHEMRFGEMAATNEIPFGRYYGSVDSTPLFGYSAVASRLLATWN
jgi:glycogen debranching enzyme